MSADASETETNRHLVLDAFELARDIRWVDMQASPYDVSAYGVPPVAVAPPAG